MTSQTTSSRKPRTQARSGPLMTGGATLDPIRIVRQQLVLIVATGLIGLVLGVGVFLVLRVYFPAYRGTSTFELVGMLDDAADPLASENRNEETVQRIAATEAAKAIGEENLEAVLAEAEVRGTNWADQFRDASGNFDEREALLELMDEVSAGYRRRTQYFDVKWAAREPKDVPVMLDAISNRYLQQRRVQRNSKLLEAKEPFINDLDDVQDSIDTLENEIQDFIASEGMLSLDMTATAIQEDLEDRKLEHNEVLSEMERTTRLIRQLDEKLAGAAEPSQDDVLEAENDAVVIRALNEVQTLRGLVSEHRQKFGEKHTQYRDSQRALDARIREKDRKVEEVVLRNLQGQRKLAADSLERLRAVEVALDDDIQKKSAELNDFVKAQANLTKMRNDVTRLEERRIRKLDMIEEIEAMFLRADADEVSWMGGVQTPKEPAFPKWFVIIPGTAIVLLGLVTGLVFLREALDKRIRSTTDLASLPGARLLGVIPDIKDDPTKASRAETVMRDFPGSVLAESHRQFGAAFRRARQDVDARSILFVGGMPGAGTTSIVSNLASIAAAAGRRVAVVDGNLRRPRIADVFGLDSTEPGLGDIIMGEASLAEVTHETQDGIGIVTAGTVRNRQIERLDAESLQRVISELRERADLILVDGPPVVVASEAMGMADQVDATVLVIRAYSEQRGLVARLMRQLGEQPSHFLGLVLNRPRNTAGGYFKRNYEAIAEYSTEHDND